VNPRQLTAVSSAIPAGLALVVQFAVCRVAIGTYFCALLAAEVWALPGAPPPWAAAGVAVFAALCALNALWLSKLVAMARARLAPGGSSDGLPACCQAPAADATGRDLHAIGAAAAGRSRVISLSARAGSLSAVEAAVHAAAYAAAKTAAAVPPPAISPPAAQPRLARSDAMPRRRASAAIAQAAPKPQPATWPGANGNPSLLVAPSLGRHGMSGPLPRLLAPPSDMAAGLEGSEIGGGAATEEECCFCGDDHHASHRRPAAHKPAALPSPAKPAAALVAAPSAASPFGSSTGATAGEPAAACAPATQLPRAAKRQTADSAPCSGCSGDDCNFCGDDHHRSHGSSLRRRLPAPMLEQPAAEPATAAPPLGVARVAEPVALQLIMPGVHSAAQDVKRALLRTGAQQQPATKTQACDCSFCYYDSCGNSRRIAVFVPPAGSDVAKRPDDNKAELNCSTLNVTASACH